MVYRTTALLTTLLLTILCSAQETLVNVYCHTSGAWSDWHFSYDPNDKSDNEIGGLDGPVAEYRVIVMPGVTLNVNSTYGSRANEIVVEKGGVLNFISGHSQAYKIKVDGECNLLSNDGGACGFNNIEYAGEVVVEGSGLLTVSNRQVFRYSAESPILTEGTVRETSPTGNNGYHYYSLGNGEWEDGQIWSVYPDINVRFYNPNTGKYNYPGSKNDIKEEVHVLEGHEITLNSSTTVGSIFVDGTLHVCGKDGNDVIIDCNDFDGWTSNGARRGVLTIGENGILDLCQNTYIDAPNGTVSINGTLSGMGNINSNRIEASQNANVTAFSGMVVETTYRDQWSFDHNCSLVYVATQSGQWDSLSWGWQSCCGLAITNTNIKEPIDRADVTIIIPEGINVSQVVGKTENAQIRIDGTLEMCTPGMWEAANQYSTQTLVEVNGTLSICSGSEVYIDGTLQINPGGKVICQGGLEYKNLVNNGELTDNGSNEKIYKSVQSGDWDNAFTWDYRGANGVPSTNDVVIIRHDITVGNDVNGTKWVTIDEGATLTITRSSTNKPFEIGYRADVNDKGRMVINSPVHIAQGALLTTLPGAMVEVYSKLSTYSDGQIIISNSSELSTSFYTGNGCQLDHKVRIERGLVGGKGYTTGSATIEGTIDSDVNDDDIVASFDVVAYDYIYAPQFGGTNNTGQVLLVDNGAPERTIIQTGNIVTGDKTYRLKIADGENYGWNLIQNPFTTSIGINDDADLFAYDKDNIEPVIWFYVKMGDSYQFVTYSLETDVEVPAASSQRWADNIAPQQGFFVKSNNNESDFTIKYPSHAIARTGLKTAQAEPDDVLRLSLSSEGSNSDQIAMVFRKGGDMHRVYADALIHLDEYDGYNYLYAIKDDEALTIPVYPEAANMAEIKMPIGMQTSGKTDLYTISAINIDQFKAAENVMLYDSQTNTTVNLREQEYSFTTTNKYEDDRFSVIISGNKVSSGPTNANISNIAPTVIPTQDGICVKTTAPSILRVYDVTGRIVTACSLDMTSNVIPLNLHGIFFVEISCNNVVTLTKILK